MDESPIGRDGTEALKSNSSSTKEHGIEVRQQGLEEEKYFDYSQRAQCMRAVVLGCNEGLVFTALYTLEAEQNRYGNHTFIIKGVAGLVAGALAVAVAEFVSVYAQVDVVVSQNDRDLTLGKVGALQRTPPPSPTQIAIASFVAYIQGGLVPLLLAWAVKDRLRDQNLMFYLAAIASFSMLLTGNMVAKIGKTPCLWSSLRVLLGGSTEIGILTGKMKLLHFFGI